jgi:predicted nucleic acid-binding protein
MVALVNRKDPHHEICMTVLGTLRDAPLLTTWACIAEAMYLLWRAGRHPAQQELWDYIAEGIVEIHANSRSEIGRMIDLMARYHDMPMDLADASLVAASESLHKNVVFSLDSDFYVYRKADGSTFTAIPDEVARGGGRSR